MQVIISFLLLVISTWCKGDSLVVRDDLKDDIEIAALDSAKLADDLAGMLERLEDGVYNEDDGEEEREETKDLVTLELLEALKITDELAAKALNRKEKPSRKTRLRRPKSEDADQSDSSLDALLAKIGVNRLKDDIKGASTSNFNRKESRKGRTRTFGKSSGIDSLLSKFGLDFDKDDLKTIDEIRPRESKSFDGTRSQENREGKSYDKPEETITCQTEDRSSAVQVCTPSHQPRGSRLHFPGQQISKGQDWCYLRTKTVCEETSESSPENTVCSFSYVQASHNVAAVSVEMALNVRSEKMGITHCHHRKTDYSKVSEEVCELVYVNQHYKIPTIQTQDLEILDMLYPEPEEHCIDFSVEIPEVKCQEQEQDVCIEASVLENKRLTLKVDQAAPKRNCQRETLNQDQEVCTREIVEKRRQYQGYGYSG